MRATESRRMLHAMSADDLRDFLRQTPFKPVTIYLADGSSIEIDHPDFAMFSRDERALYVSLRERTARGVHTIGINLNSITRVEGALADPV